MPVAFGPINALVVDPDRISALRLSAEIPFLFVVQAEQTPSTLTARDCTHARYPLSGIAHTYTHTHTHPLVIILLSPTPSNETHPW